MSWVDAVGSRPGAQGGGAEPAAAEGKLEAGQGYEIGGGGGGGCQNLVGYPLRILKLRRLVIDEVERRGGSFVILGGMEFKERSLWFRVSE